MKINILIPVYNDWKSVTKLMQNINFEIQNTNVEFSIIIVNDGSTDVVPKIDIDLNYIKSLKILNLKKNMSHQRSIAIGLRHIYENENFDYVIPMDGDGEDRPEEIKEFIKKIKQYPNDVIVGERVKRSEGIIFKIGYSIHKLITYIFTGKNIKFGNFTCISKSKVNELLNEKATWNSYSGSLTKITEEGAAFRSYKDGSKLFLSPESAMEIQRKLGPDFVVQLDECTAMHVSEQYTEDSMHMSHRWGDRSLEAFNKTHDGTQAIYGVVQGGVFQNLREQSAAFTATRPFFGTAIGGTFGGNFDQFFEIVSWCMPHIAQDRPVHLLGIGTFKDIFECVRLGIDTFDCVSPTRIARHGWALMKGAPGERLNLRNAKYAHDQDPIWPELGIPCSSQFSKGYIHHLFKANESLGGQLLAQHNIAVMAHLMREIRKAIKENTLDELQKEWVIE